MTILALRKEALDSLKKDAGLADNRQLATYLNVSESTVSRVASGGSKPSNQFIASVLFAFPVKFEDVFEMVDAEESLR